MPAPARWTVRDAGPDDLGVVASTMAQAFHDDPVMRWTFPARRGRDRKMVDYFDLMARQLFLPRGRVLMTEDGSGVAFWAPSGALPLVPLDKDAFVRGSHALFGARAAILEQGGMLMERYHPAEPHFYLGGIGVMPSRRGRGIGRSLLMPVLDVCDEQRIGAYLEASTMRNVALYEQLGFRVRRELALPDGPSLFLMWREPQSRPA